MTQARPLTRKEKSLNRVLSHQAYKQQEQIKTLTEENKALTSQVEELEETCTQQRLEVNKQVDEIAAIQKQHEHEIDELKKQIDSHLEAIKELTREKDILEKELIDTDNKVQLVTEENERLKEENANQRKLVCELTSEKDTLSYRIDGLEETQRDLEDKFSCSEENFLSLKSRNNELERDIQTLYDELMTENKNKQTAAVKLQETERRLQNQRESTRTMVHYHDAARDEIRRLQDQLTQTQQQRQDERSNAIQKLNNQRQSTTEMLRMVESLKALKKTSRLITTPNPNLMTDFKPTLNPSIQNEPLKETTAETWVSIAQVAPKTEVVIQTAQSVEDSKTNDQNHPNSKDTSKNAPVNPGTTSSEDGLLTTVAKTLGFGSWFSNSPSMLPPAAASSAKAAELSPRSQIRK